MSLWLERVNHFLWNGILLWVMLGLGAWLTLRSGFYPIRKIQEIWRFTFGSLFSEKKLLKKQGISPFAAVSTALAGTIGTRQHCRRGRSPYCGRAWSGFLDVGQRFFWDDDKAEGDLFGGPLPGKKEKTDSITAALCNIWKRGLAQRLWRGYFPFSV